MTKEEKEVRTERVRKMNRLLRKLYPDVRIELNHGNTWELLVAVILSAQCTDARVNQVTEKLFNKYRTVEEYAHASQREMERMVFPCGFYRNKAKHIRQSARMILRDFGGLVPKTMEELTTLSGVARKTANVVLSNAFNIHEGIAVFINMAGPRMGAEAIRAMELETRLCLWAERHCPVKGRVAAADNDQAFARKSGGIGDKVVNPQAFQTI